MDSFTVIFDACVLYPAPLRDLLMRLSDTGLFRARWTDMIHEEWTRNVLKARQDIKPETIKRTRELMDAHVEGCKVTGFESLIDSIALPDPDDRHVLAAAIVGAADVIVTFNLKDFPAALLDPYEIEAQHPDDFLTHLLDLSPATVYGAFRRQLDGLKSPPRTAEQLLDTLERQGIPQAVRRLREIEDVIWTMPTAHQPGSAQPFLHASHDATMAA